MDLVFQPDTTIGVHGDHKIQILAGFTKPAKISGVQEPDLQPDSLDKRVEFYHVEHILIMFPREIFPTRVPEFVELDSPIVRFHVIEPSVGWVVQVGVVVPVVIACNLEITVWMESLEWVPQPHYVSILNVKRKYLIYYYLLTFMGWKILFMINCK